MVLALQQKGRIKSRAEILLDAPENMQEKRRMIRLNVLRQTVSNLSVFGIVTFTIYCSSLYFGAFVDIGEVFGASQAVTAKRAKLSVRHMPRLKQNTIMPVIRNRFTLDRFYMRRGQSVLATYSLPEKTKLRLTVRQCKTIPIFEIFYCTPIGDQEKIIRNKTTGFIEFTAIRPGFYHFGQYAVKPNKTALNANIDYQVVWQRGGKSAQ